MKIMLLTGLMLIVHQLSGQITGQVKDFRLGAPLVGAEIFLANGMAKTKTDAKGYFTLEGLAQGQMRIGCSKKGYLTTFQVVQIGPKTESALFILKSDKSSRLQDESIKSAVMNQLLKQSDVLKDWSRDLKVVDSELRKDMDDAGKERIFGRIALQNNLLGYELLLHLINYAPGSPEYYLQFTPKSDTDGHQQKQWDDARFLAYQVSVNNFLESILQGTSGLHGYTAFDQDRQPLNLENFLQVGFSGQPNFIQINGPIRITQILNGHSYNSQFIVKNRISFTDQGLIMNHDSVAVSGAMAEVDLSLTLPLEYTPSPERKIFKLDQYFEKAYLHTDRSYYYPGDTLWFKGYMNYKTLALIESLSKVLHVELLDAHKGGRVIVSKQLKIEDGEAWGEFILPDSITGDFIAIRAFTNWQLNYGTEQIFVKYLPFLKGRVNLQETRNNLVINDKVKVKFDKKSYFRRDQIQMAINVSNDKNEPVSAWMSVSVTDMSMVKPVLDSCSILTHYAIKSFPSSNRIQYPLEKGLEIKGRYLDVTKRPKPVTLTVNSKPFGSFKFETDLNAGFSITGLDFSDSTIVNFTASNGKKDLEGGSIDLFKQAPISTANLIWPKQIESIQPFDYKMDQRATRLKDVVVSAARQRKISDAVKAEEAIKRSRPYGEPDYTLDENRLNYGSINVIEMMRGKIPGLQVSFDGSNYQIKSTRALSFTLSTEPVVVVDDVPLGGSAVSNLLMLNPANVAAIEVILRLTALAGSTGGTGIILIYTKTGGLRGKYAEYEVVHRVKIVGYSKPITFQGIDHTQNYLPLNSDFRPTLYWNPSVVSSVKYGNTNLSFFASDSVGPYLITIEGVTSEGKPFRHEQILEISQ